MPQMELLETMRFVEPLLRCDLNFMPPAVKARFESLLRLPRDIYFNMTTEHRHL